MIENNENTEFHGNPESGIDQLLNRPAKPTYEELEAKLAEAKKSIEYKHEEMLRYKEAWDTLRLNVSKAEESFKEILAGDMDAKDIMETYGAVLVEHLSWDLENEVEVEITVTWRGTVTLPFGTEVADLDINDFGINEPEHNEYSSYFRGITDYSIDER